jgi:MoaA/NifB/PqqE/SkfB family radical SAM enzyme
MVTGAHRRAVKTLLWARIGQLALQRFRNPVAAGRALRAMVATRARVRERRVTTKYVRAAGRYFWDLYSPGWPSASFDRYVLAELERFTPATSGEGPAPQPGLQTLILAVTKKCPLRCRHCCEWDALNAPETLDRDRLAAIVAGFQRVGVSQILLSGGEPLQRFDDVLHLLRTAAPGTDFWILTSGLGLTDERARRLRAAGLTGVCISLDHWEPAAHDAFRGFPGSFQRAREAAAAARAAGLALCLTLCPTREFLRDGNLERYASLARDLGAGFVQILEPRAVGHFAGQDVTLGEREREALEALYLRLNFDPEHVKMPAVAYPAYGERRNGCGGAGSRFAYVDTDGRLHPCPFCRCAAGSVADLPPESALARLRRGGCPAASPSPAPVPAEV